MDVSAGDQPSESELVIRELYAIACDQSLGFRKQVKRLLKMGCDRFGLDIGILSEISGDRYEVVHVHAPDEVDIQDGAAFELGNTYCEITLRGREPVGFSHAGSSQFASHPCYRLMRLEAYLGTPLTVNGQLFGTLNFSSFERRRREFRDVDLDCIQLMATWLGGELARKRAEWRLRVASRALEQTRRRAMVGSLVAAFRHELANPMAVALINTELIETANADSSKSLGLARQALARMQDVLSELATFADDPATTASTFDLRNLIQRTVDEPGSMGRVIAQLETVMVTAVEARIYQCLHNILVAHLHGRGATNQPVTVRCGAQDGFARVVVDSHCEQPMGSIRADLFAALRGESPFQEVPLALAGRIAEEYGGRVETSPTSVGTRTVLELPAG